MKSCCYQMPCTCIKAEKYKIDDEVIWNNKPYKIAKLDTYGEHVTLCIYNGTGGVHWVLASKVKKK